jgi:hypothetical protein
MTPHKATPEQWAQLIDRAVDHVFFVSSCLLELRDRIEALEAAANRRAILGSSPAPDDGLVELVVDAITDSAAAYGTADEPARAAILAVAEWLNKKAEAHLGGGAYWSRQLRKEVERHG